MPNPDINNEFVQTEFKFKICLEDLELNLSASLLCHQSSQSSIEIQTDRIDVLEFAHLLAIENWLTRYIPPANATNLEKVRGYLEAFHHFCEISQWETASQILLMKLDTSNAKELHELLGVWGHHQEQIDLYQRLLGKLDSSFDCLCLHGLGVAYCRRGQVRKAILYHQQQLELARSINATISSAYALIGIAEVYWLQHNVQATIDSAEQALSLARSSDNLHIMAETLTLLGSVYSLNPDTVPDHKTVQRSLQYIQEALEIARSLSDRSLELSALSALAGVCLVSGQTQTAIAYSLKQLETARDTSNLHQQWVALSNLGTAYVFMGNSKNGISYIEQAFSIAQQTGNPYHQALNLSNLAAFYTRDGDFSHALEILQATFQIQQQLGLKFLNATDCLNLSYCSSGTKKINQAVWYARKAIVLARREHSQEMYAFGVIALSNAYWQKGQKLYGLSVFLGQLPTLLAATMHSTLAQFILRSAIVTFSQPMCNVIDRILKLVQFRQRNHKPT